MVEAGRMLTKADSVCLASSSLGAPFQRRIHVFAACQRRSEPDVRLLHHWRSRDRLCLSVYMCVYSVWSRFNNAKHYNQNGSDVYNAAQKLQKALKVHWKGLNRELQPETALLRAAFDELPSRRQTSNSVPPHQQQQQQHQHGQQGKAGLPAVPKRGRPSNAALEAAAAADPVKAWMQQTLKKLIDHSDDSCAAFFAQVSRGRTISDLMITQRPSLLRIFHHPALERLLPGLLPAHRASHCLQSTAVQDQERQLLAEL